MKTSYVVALAGLAAMSASCRKQTSEVKSTTPAEIFCAASGAWFTLLGHGGGTPGVVPAVGIVFSSAVGQLERSEPCAGSGDRQFGVNDVAAMIHDELAQAEVVKAANDLRAVTSILQNMYNSEVKGGDGRGYLTNSLQPITTTAMAQFERKGITYGDQWAMATGFRVDIMDKILALDLASTDGTQEQRDAVVRKDVATMIAILDGIEPQVGKMQKDADRISVTYFEPKIYGKGPILDIGRRDFCRDPVPFTAAENGYLGSFFSKKDWPQVLTMRQQTIDAGPICVDFQEQLNGCDGACADAVNGAVSEKTTAIATAMKTDLIDKIRHMALLRARAPKIRERMNDLLATLKTGGAAAAAPAPAPSATTSDGSGGGSSRNGGEEKDQSTDGSGGPASSTGVRGR